MREKISVQNVNHPGSLTNVDAAKYQAMHAALMKIVPGGAPGLSQKDLLRLVGPELPQEYFPQGKTSGWWLKTVQLDLEAKGELIRVIGKPLRWHLP